MEIYGTYGKYLPEIKDEIMHKIDELNHEIDGQGGRKLYEHLIGRVKCEDSMIEKCQRKGLALTPKSALGNCKDAIGIRVVCNFIDDIYKLVDLLKAQEWCRVIKEKDYVSKSKPNGYRSYHLIIKVSTPYPDIYEKKPGEYYAEIQLRTIAMDSWASLEHELKYKHNIKNPEQIGNELKRCADQLASCDVQMQTIRQVIHEYD
ncbi:GTP pyrophosphokinase family protein [Liquorilactobacillus mali]|mgnify:CR=1 FL=1|uniref:PpGpp synthetase hydrolase catalytic subunit n=1 Tax=Liquorilactobacillus mali TaxID=1618 RepID=A0A0R2FMS2_9LACO|nr:GTP pyrophosphokinase [Liquorilactobacillus mali]KRN29887.1 ppGpp synthetase hydrolase catalytic subunit [Liquorilactobacillus mali]MDN7145971.1 GTP pyrophosphokinase family protein [Liquorilactobacillus mali]